MCIRDRAQDGIYAVDGNGQAIHHMGSEDTDFRRIVELTETTAVPQLTTSSDGVLLVDNVRLEVQRVAGERLVESQCIASSTTDVAIGQASTGALDLPMVDRQRNELLLSPLGSSPNLPCRAIDLEQQEWRYGPPVISDDVAYVPNWANGTVLRVELGTAEPVSYTHLTLPTKA